MYIRTIMQPYIIQKGHKNISTSIFKVGKHCTYVSDNHLACYRTECGWRIVFSLVFDLTGLFVLHTSKPVTVLLYINYILNVNFLNFWPLRWCFHARGQKARRSIQGELLLFLLLFEAPREILSSVSVVKLLKKHPEWLKFGQVLTFETIYVAKVQDHVTWTGHVSWKLCGGIKRWRQCPGRSMESWAAVLTSSHCKSQPGTIMQCMFCEQVVSRDGWKGARVR